MTIFDLLPLAGLFLGLYYGFYLGSSYGIIIGILCSCLCGVICFFLGRVPFLFALLSLGRKFNKKTDEELLNLIHDPEYLAPNIVLLELKKRDYDIKQELPLVLDLLESTSKDKRIRGWHAIASAFPQYIQLLAGFNINDPSEECIKKIQRLRDSH